MDTDHGHRKNKSLVHQALLYLGQQDFFTASPPVVETLLTTCSLGSLSTFGFFFMELRIVSLRGTKCFQQPGARDTNTKVQLHPTKRGQDRHRNSEGPTSAPTPPPACPLGAAPASTSCPTPATENSAAAMPPLRLLGLAITLG